MQSAFPRCAFALCATLASLALSAEAASFDPVNLVTDDQMAHAAKISDPGLVNAWGLSSSPTSPFWISANGSGQADLYSVNPTTQATTKVGLTVAIPGAGSVTGQVFNSNPAAFHGDAFLFVSEDGTVSGWRDALGTVAETAPPFAATSPANVCKGVAL